MPTKQAKSTAPPKKTVAPKVKAVEIKRRLRSLPPSAAKDAATAKKYYGGAFPTINGRKYKYPSPSDEVEWMKLIRAAVKFGEERRAAMTAGVPIPVCADARILYVAFHAKAKEIKRRTIRNKHRRQHGIEVGDERQVHHNDPVRMQFSNTQILTHCQHKRKHGQVCEDEKVKMKKVARARIK